MATRDYEVQPVTDKLNLDEVIRGLCTDLDALRGGKISVQDAIARSLLAKQIFNGVRIYLSATKMLAAIAQNTDAIADSQPSTPESR